MLRKIVFFALIFNFIALSLWAEPDICDGLSSLDSAVKSVPHENTSKKCLDKMVCSQQDRVKIVCEMREVILNKYSLLYLKKERIGLDSKEHLNQCVQTEKEMTNDNNLHFLDRMQQCIASFQDTHFGIEAAARRPSILVGIFLKEIDQKFYISQKLSKIILYIQERNELKDLDKLLSIGTEVVEIDGQSIEDGIHRLEPFIGASSAIYRREGALQALFWRNFNYPTKNYMDIKVKTGAEEKVIRLPWWWNKLTGDRVDTALLFKELDIPSTELPAWDYSEEKMEWKRKGSGVDGYSDANPLILGNALSVYADDDENTSLSMGEVIASAQKVFCYMQLRTFASKSFKKINADGSLGEPQDFLKPIKGFIAQCKEKELPLILDLRVNGGGRGSYPAQLLSILMEKDKTYASHVMSVRATAHSGWFLSQMLNHTELAARFLSNYTDARYFWDEYENAVNKQEEHISLMVGEDIKTDEDVKGYDKKIVALITPNCISACDMTASLLKNSKRATLIGTHTNGTGAGFWDDEENGFPRKWVDSHNTLQVYIPNSLFGVPSKEIVEKEGHILPFKAHKNFISENIPTVADVQFSPTLKDITGETKGWLNKALEVLFPAAPQPEPAAATSPAETTPEPEGQ
ncbi:MAG: hypothetical protein A2Z91_02060 [Deltaproteobacteria bacterium GWA2_38_16]|nr:MAG: hypothetical protein A2Z91_02060 [Deltaproteobacteria bacterium GWA2_38_16]OGQ01980.1 MAG: hypothetical protein A3D19_08355 [Deltaproteobacteria bacterium RIFCSPHIGHO2_02_FULL_38_15]OGQ33675.1 MAG: hypothetical protein A3A72_05620 [Deltaproteobacteria bacterium RIFCSPLOWO2_01_FULL_38_9]OGQ62853.1 MAG: hypothetical protein A3G92_02480 [Deltaproteobacteria bacterium RIFCSPLOWO2_12_FULL_38_8]